MEAASDPPFNADGPAEIARLLTEGGYPVSTQQIGNWKQRGVPDKALVSVCRTLRLIPAWLSEGAGPKRGMINTPPEPVAPDPRIAELLAAFIMLDDAEQRKVLAKIKYKAELASIKDPPKKQA